MCVSLPMQSVGRVLLITMGDESYKLGKVEDIDSDSSNDDSLPTSG